MELALKSIYGSNLRADFAGAAQEFSLRSTAAILGTVRLVRADVSGYSCIRQSDDLVQIFAPVRGSVSLRSGTAPRDTVADCNGVAVMRPGERTTVKVSSGSAFMLSLPLSGLIARAQMLTGETYDGSILSEMSGLYGQSSPAVAALTRNIKSAIAEAINLDSIGMARLASSAYEQLLLDMASTVLFPSVALRIAQPHANAGPAALREARDYIAGHAADPIDLSQLAGSLGISARAMQAGFRRQYGISAREFITQCRLELAREQLQAADQRASVSDIAFASGFANLSHFAIKYRERYGELPSTTKRSSGG